MRITLLIVSIMCTGMRIVRAWSAIARLTPTAGSTRWRRSRTCSRAGTRTSRPRASGRCCLPGSGRGTRGRGSCSAWRSTRRGGGSPRSARCLPVLRLHLAATDGAGATSRSASRGMPTSRLDLLTRSARLRGWSSASSTTSSAGIVKRAADAGRGRALSSLRRGADRRMQISATVLPTRCSKSAHRAIVARVDQVAAPPSACRRSS